MRRIDRQREQSRVLTQTATRQAGLMRERLAADIKRAPLERCRREHLALAQRQRSLLERISVSDRERVEPILRAQKVQLDRSQEHQLDLERRARDDAAREQRRPDDVERGIRQAVELARAIQADTDRRLDRQLQELGRDTLDADRPARVERMQRDDAEILRRDHIAATSALERAVALERNRLSEDQVQRIQSIFAGNAETARLDRDAIQRIADEVRCPGRERLDTGKARDKAQERAQGQLFEELRAVHTREEIAQENARNPQRNLVYIDGARIRDEQQKKISDGMTVAVKDLYRLLVDRAYEDKSTREAARGFSRTLDKLTDKDREQVAEEAREEAREELRKRPGAREMSERQRQDELERLREDFEKQLLSYGVQKQAGQQARTMERLDQTDRVYIDGRAYELERERRLDQLVQKSVTEDARRRDKEAQHLAVTSREVQDMARRLLDELLREEDE